MRQFNNPKPNSDIEEKLGGVVVGIDEAGRGSLAGPVIAASVILPDYHSIVGIDDSKKLSKIKRELLFKRIIANCYYGIGIVGAAEIEQMNILQATLLAMRKALNNVTIAYDFVLVDGNISPFSGDSYKSNVKSVIKGDQISLSIAAASIVAKVMRDNIMLDLDQHFPQYCWKQNNGYATIDHIKAIKRYGSSIHHRKSFLKNIYKSLSIKT